MIETCFESKWILFATNDILAAIESIVTIVQIQCLCVREHDVRGVSSQIGFF
jgi:hypothetical protein